MTEAPYKAPALEKGLDILECLASLRTPQSISDIARHIGRSRSEIYRMVVVLEMRGYVERTDDPEKLQLSNRLFEVGMRSPPKMDLHEAALPEMSTLAARMMQSIQLAVVSADQIVVIARTESPDDVGFSVRLGHRRSIMKSASGIVLFAFASPVQEAKMLEDLKAAGASQEELDALYAQTKQVREQGFVSMPSRMVDGVTDISAPIFNAISSSAVASLTVPFVVTRRARVSLGEAPNLVVEAAQRISAALGRPAPPPR
ncbi:IclR family transcriptional regulator [Hyphomonas sp. WL0036]|uniref:IclR family transcriptional regulator n=1 Tax=Hyphomonas sediminis TaxID=2866160 RepID=UPI001C806E14|nr:IclR family transcriptional regulator [Hyphomonas sediminis]MBY9067176.1 IclR family transcriptional regulator [Hyphomonas sediminis]